MSVPIILSGHPRAPRARSGRIVERPLRWSIDIQVPDYARMGFILGYSNLGDSLGDGESGEAWRTLIADATGITATRGSSRTGLGLRADVGLMTFTLHEAENPLAGGTLAPGQLVRMIVRLSIPEQIPHWPPNWHSRAVDEPVFTGRVADVAAGFPRSKTTGRGYTLTTITVADAVAVHVGTPRYGVRIPDGFETFEDRLARLAVSARAPLAVPTAGAPREVYSF